MKPNTTEEPGKKPLLKPPKFTLNKKPDTEILKSRNSMSNLRGSQRQNSNSNTSSTTQLPLKKPLSLSKQPLKMQGETLLQRRRGNSQSNKTETMTLNTGTKNNMVNIKKIVDKESQKQFENDFTQALLELRSFQEEKKLADQQDDAIKELCNRITVLIQDWEKQPDVTQKMCARESLLQGLIFIIRDIENPKVRLRSIKQALNIFKSIGFKYIFSNTQSKTAILPPEALLELLQAVLKQTLKLQKNKDLEKILLEENMTTTYLELLLAIYHNTESQDITIPRLNLLIGVYQIMKNETNNETVRKKYYQPANLQLVCGFLHFFEFDEKQIQGEKAEKIYEFYIAVTALIRNLAIDVNCTIAYHKYRVVEKLTKSIELYPHINELMLNTMRILSKISLNRECSLQMFENQYFIKNILGFFKSYKSNLFIIIRISFILANMTSFIEDIRNFIYFDQKGFIDIYDCFDYYTQKEIQPQGQKDETEQMNITNTGWDFKQLSKENDSDALIKIIRLIANLLTIEAIGMDLIKNKNMHYKELIKKLRSLVQNKDITSKSEIISCCLSCLANITFYEKNPLTTADFEYKNAKLELVVILGPYIMQTDNESICCEGLRVISNLSRQKELIKNMIKFKIVDGVIVLLDSNSKEIVYYALGVLINLMKSEEIKTLYIQQVIESTLSVIKDCTLEENDLLLLGFQCLGNLIDTKSQLGQLYIKQIEEILDQTGDDCDSLIEQSQDLNETQSIPQIFDLRSVINQLQNNLPEEAYECPVPNCGRKFKNQEDLQGHIKRRHNL